MGGTYLVYNHFDICLDIIIFRHFPGRTEPAADKGIVCMVISCRKRGKVIPDGFQKLL